MRTRLMVLLSVGLLVSSLPAAAQFYTQHNLVSDDPAVPADRFDPHLVNAWGLVSSATSPWWSANNGTGTSTLYDGNGVPRALVVTIPGAPTGTVFNGNAAAFIVSSGAAAGPARFIFATEDGAIAGWNPAVRPTDAVIAADRSAADHKAWRARPGAAMGSYRSGPSAAAAAAPDRAPSRAAAETRSAGRHTRVG